MTHSLDYKLFCNAMDLLLRGYRGEVTFQEQPIKNTYLVTDNEDSSMDLLWNKTYQQYTRLVKEKPWTVHWYYIKYQFTHRIKDVEQVHEFIINNLEYDPKAPQ